MGSACGVGPAASGFAPQGRDGPLPLGLTKAGAEARSAGGGAGPRPYRALVWPPRLVDEIEREGLVERVPDPADRRASFAVITDRGRRALRAAASAYLEGIHEQSPQHLEPHQLKTIRTGLEQVLAAHSAGAGADAQRVPGKGREAPTPGDRRVS